jgi:carbon-monoxide dehydrogenase small subunit
MSEMHQVRVTVNGHAYTGLCEARMTLADFLRHECGLTGTHVGCEHGVCGACTITVDGSTARACLMLAVQADGSSITTVEGLADGEDLNGLQEAFWNNHGLQCGFCTPGMLMTATELLKEIPNPTETQVRERIAGNLCRCTGYAAIVKSVLAAAEQSQAESPAH